MSWICIHQDETQCPFLCCRDKPFEVQKPRYSVRSHPNQQEPTLRSDPLRTLTTMQQVNILFGMVHPSTFERLKTQLVYV